MFSSAVTVNTSSGFKSEGVYVTTNGGASWFGSDTCKGQNIQNHGGDPGVAIDKFGVFILNHIGNPSLITGVYSHYSSDMGANWSNAYTLTSQQPEDKGTTTSDNTPASPYYGRVYATWVNYVSPFPVLFSYTSNSGVNWSSPLSVNGTPPQRCSGGYVETGSDGKIYVVWAGVINISPYSEQYVGFASSTNGGNSWNVNQNIYAEGGINGILPSKSNIRVNGLPQIAVDNSGGARNGWLYIITTEKNLAPAGTDPDIILHRSSNAGLNWSAGIRVNQDAPNNGKIQYFPAMNIDSTGAINILFYDDRNTSSDSAEVFIARSQDGGNSWYERAVSEHRFKPKPIVGFASNYQGDHISMTSVGNKLYALWMDDYSGIYQVWCKIMDINTIGIRKIFNEVPDAFTLYQNYPNPFNPSTNIRFSIKDAQFVSLKVFDINGKVISTPVNQKLASGHYEVTFDSNILSSGLYFYRLTAGNYSETKKMVLVR